MSSIGLHVVPTHQVVDHEGVTGVLITLGDLKKLAAEGDMFLVMTVTGRIITVLQSVSSSLNGAEEKGGKDHEFHVFTSYQYECTYQEVKRTFHEEVGDRIQWIRNQGR